MLYTECVVLKLRLITVWCMMHDAWCMMYDAWCMMHDAWCISLMSRAPNFSPWQAKSRQYYRLSEAICLRQRERHVSMRRMLVLLNFSLPTSLQWKKGFSPTMCSGYSIYSNNWLYCCIFVFISGRNAMLVLRYPKMSRRSNLFWSSLLIITKLLKTCAITLPPVTCRIPGSKRNAMKSLMTMLVSFEVKSL